jgi:hypothetical protein
MSSAFEAMGMSLPYSSTMTAEDIEKLIVQKSPLLFWLKQYPSADYPVRF